MKLMRFIFVYLMMTGINALAMEAAEAKAKAEAELQDQNGQVVIPPVTVFELPAEELAAPSAATVDLDQTTENPSGPRLSLSAYVADSPPATITVAFSKDYEKEPSLKEEADFKFWFAKNKDDLRALKAGLDTYLYKKHNIKINERITALENELKEKTQKLQEAQAASALLGSAAQGAHLQPAPERVGQGAAPQVQPAVSSTPVQLSDGSSLARSATSAAQSASGISSTLPAASTTQTQTVSAPETTKRAVTDSLPQSSQSTSEKRKLAVQPSRHRIPTEQLGDIGTAQPQQPKRNWMKWFGMGASVVAIVAAVVVGYRFGYLEWLKKAVAAQ
jgi:hypothetical protein